MEELKRTQLYDRHISADAKMVDFGGWEMPIQYPSGIIAEHLYTRRYCSLFDVSHMGRLIVSGPDRKAFLQHIVTSNVDALDVGMAQYSILPDEEGCGIDDLYIYRFVEDKYVVIANAANTDLDWDHLMKEKEGFDVTIENVSKDWAAIAVQGPTSKDILSDLIGGKQPTEPIKNYLNIATMPEVDDAPIYIAKTGYTGEPIGYEIYVPTEVCGKVWDLLIEKGARPAGLGARDTTRLEAGMPLHGHEMGRDKDGNKMPIYAVPLAKFAVSFAPQKGEFIGKEALAAQKAAFLRINNHDYSDMAALPKRIQPIVLLGKGVLRAGCPVLKDGKEVGYVTSGTMVPYSLMDGETLFQKVTEESQKRSIGFCYVDSDVETDDQVEVDIRGKHLAAAIPECHMKNDAPPYVRVLLYEHEDEEEQKPAAEKGAAAKSLFKEALENHLWRQEACINLIPSEMSASRAVRLLECSDPSFRYAEHRKTAAFYDEEVFYYQGTKFIGKVEEALMAEMKQYFGCKEVETRVTSGQMANTCVFSALVDYKNRLDRKVEAKRLGYILNNHIIKGGHLSAQPMGALKDFAAIDPVTEKRAVVNFPVMENDPYCIDVEETKKVIEEYDPELIIFGKSMVLYPEPVKEIRQFLDEQGRDTIIMYDMAHVLGLVGDHFQKPFEEGANFVTGSTHKTFFGPQRGVVAGNWDKDDHRYELWETVQSRAFPGSTSNHHLGTQLALLMAVYEMNEYKDAYQKAVVSNAKAFAKALKEAGLDVQGDPAKGYTQTHQVIVSVGYGEGPEVAERLEQNNIICNYQATPEEEGFTASGALRLGVSEMTRFGFTEKDFAKLADLMAACIKNGTEVKDEVKALRADHMKMQYCFDDQDMVDVMDAFAKKTGL